MRVFVKVLGLITLAALSPGCGDTSQIGKTVFQPFTFGNDHTLFDGPITAAGTLKPAGEIEVGSQVSGRIAEVLVDFNDIVQEGDIIARIDPESFEAQVRRGEAVLADASANALMRKAALRRAEFEFQVDEASLPIVQARTKSASANYQQATRTLDRTSRLESSNATSEDAMDRAKTEHSAAEALLHERQAEQAAQKLMIQSAGASVDVARAELLHAQAVVAQRQAELEDAKVALSRTSIRSPMDGVVISRNITSGQTVAASLEAPVLFKIAHSLSEMEIHARIDEADIAQIHPGQLAHFRVVAHGDRKFEARVKQVRVAPETVDNVVIYTVVLLAGNTDALLLPGMTTIIEINTQEPVANLDNSVESPPLDQIEPQSSKADMQDSM